MYDLHIHSKMSIGENSVEEIAEFARRLGMKGIGIVRYYPDFQALPKMREIDIVNCIMLKASSPGELNKMASSARTKAEVLMVHGGNYEVNRAACENNLIDIVCHPELGRKDSGLDHICMKAAAANNVAIELNFREILESFRKNRAHILSMMARNILLAKKFGARMICTSGAVSIWNMRTPRDMSSIANILGMDLGEAIKASAATPHDIIEINRKKLGEQYESA